MDSNAVRMLNELCASSLMALAYEVGPPSGAPHLPTFTATVRVTRHALGDMLVLDAATTGSGHSKDEARQAAAGAMLRHPHFLAALPQHLGAGAVGARWAAAGQHHMAVPPHVPQLPANYKAALQEAVQKAGLAQLPQYTLLRSDGPPHMPNFTMQVAVQAAHVTHTAQGEGRTRKAAEQAAACALLGQPGLRQALGLGPLPVQQLAGAEQ